MHHMAFIDGARRVNLSLDEYMLKNYGDRYHKKYSTVKHRYVYFVGDKRQRRAMAKQLTWPIVTPYPKMAPDHYYDSAQIKIQLALF